MVTEISQFQKDKQGYQFSHFHKGTNFIICFLQTLHRYIQQGQLSAIRKVAEKTARKLAGSITVF
jgi:hypothetical protein